ncbi:helix-hairpin-helix domain-containing protein [Lactobacillus sp. Marseille-P7033]|nr:helix-hairpin-helix domain-containing protein [Lactobacillus sp. Marseille-P7033]NGC78468.1 competence protein ComEA [Limosilactobacillus reuteri]
MEQLAAIWDRYRLQIIILMIIAAIGGYWVTSSHDNDLPISNTNTNAVLASSDSRESMMNSKPAKSSVAIDIKGAVKRPGVYQLKAEDRINEALSIAGGPLPNADLRQVNLAKQLTDQQMIYIPVRGETIQGPVETGTSSVDGDQAANSSMVNLNTATKEQLCQITGIGDKKADLILQYRQEHGQFKNVEELKEINGFGDKTVAKLKDHLSV